METISSAFLRLNRNDFVRGLVVAVFGAVLTFLAQKFNMPGFDFASLNFGQIVNIALIAGLSYLSKNFLSTSDGKVLGSIG